MHFVFYLSEIGSKVNVYSSKQWIRNCCCCNHFEEYQIPCVKISDTPSRKYWLPQLSILYCLFFKLFGLLWQFFVFLLFLFVITALLFLFWTPSAKSWLSRMQGSVVLIFALCWCSVYLFIFCKLCLQSGFPSFCCGLCCSSNYLLYFMVFKDTSVIGFSLHLLHLIWSNLWFCKNNLVKHNLRKKKIYFISFLTSPQQEIGHFATIFSTHSYWICHSFVDVCCGVRHNIWIFTWREILLNIIATHQRWQQEKDQVRAENHEPRMEPNSHLQEHSFGAGTVQNSLHSAVTVTVLWATLGH